jgi:hypothetical protein
MEATCNICHALNQNGKEIEGTGEETAGTFDVGTTGGERCA